MSYSFNCEAFKLNPNIKTITLSNQIHFPEQKNLNLKCLDSNYAETIDADYYSPHVFVEGEAVGTFTQTGKKHGIASLFTSADVIRDPFDSKSLIFGSVPYLSNYFGFQEENLDVSGSEAETDKSKPGEGDAGADQKSVLLVVGWVLEICWIVLFYLTGVVRYLIEARCV